MILYDLVSEVPLQIVSHKYNVGRGAIQSLQTMSGTFAGMVTIFAKCLNWFVFLAG